MFFFFSLLNFKYLILFVLQKNKDKKLTYNIFKSHTWTDLDFSLAVNWNLRIEENE